MLYRFAPDEIAFYVPPTSTSPIASDVAHAKCRIFLSHVSDIDPKSVRLYDDREAVVANGSSSGSFFAVPEGATPAFDRLVADIARGEVRVLFVAHLTALSGIPHSERLRELEDRFEIMEASIPLVVPPTSADLDVYERGDPGYWGGLLWPLMFARPESQRYREPLIDTPDEVIEAFLARRSVKEWCRIAREAAETGLPFEAMREKGVRALRWWLEGQPYREHVSIANEALWRGEWDEALAHAQTARKLASKLPREAVDWEGTGRIAAAARLGRREYDAALTELKDMMLLETLFPKRWSKSPPVPLERGLPERERVMRHAAQLFRRAQSIEDTELQDAFARLSASLPKDEAAAFAAIVAKQTARYRGGPGDGDASSRDVSAQPTRPEKSVESRGASANRRTPKKSVRRNDISAKRASPAKNARAKKAVGAASKRRKKKT